MQKKYSKLAVVSCVVFFLGLVGIISSGISYANQLSFLIANLVDIIIGVIAFFILRNINYSELKGKIFAQIGFYGWVGLYVVWILVSVLLIYKSNEIRNFATETTPKAFNSDLSALPGYSTSDLAKLIQTGKEFEGYKEKMKEVGELNECVLNESDAVSIGFGPYISYGKIKIGFVGSYVIHCYSKDKAIIIGVELKKDDGTWKIVDFLFNSNITKNTDVEKNQIEEKIKDIKSE